MSERMEHSGNTSSGDTWPKLLSENHRRFGDRRKAMRHKRFGIWQALTWKDYYHDVKHLALGLVSLGFEPGDRLLVVGDNAPQRYGAELAAQANRGVAVGLYPDISTSELLHAARTTEVRYAVVQDQEQVDKVLEIKGSLPRLEKIVFWNYKGLSNYRDPALLGYREALELGAQHEASHPGHFEKSVEEGKADDVCAIVFTSGTTGPEPKAAVHTFRTLRAGSELFLHLDPWRDRDDLVPYLPPAGIVGQWTGIGCHLLSGCVLNFVESPETHQRDATEIGPTVVMHEARVWESLAAGMQARIVDAQGLKGLALRLLLPGAYQRADARLLGKETSGLAQLLQPLADVILVRRMRKKLGLGRARICYSTGAVLSPSALRFFHALGVPLKSVYVTTEGGAVAAPSSEDVRLDSVGMPFTGCEVKISDDGEILCRQPGMFSGYYEDGPATAGAVRYGWFHTGDVGRLDSDGRLVFLGRMGGVVALARGGRLAPQDVECRLRSSPYIRDAWVFAGPEGEYVSAAIVINGSMVGRWAGQQGILFNTFEELSQAPEVYSLVRREIERVNGDLPAGCRIEKYVNLGREFDPDQGEMTRTRNLKRVALENHYRSLIEAVYAGKTTVLIPSPGQRDDGGGEAKGVELSIASTGAASA